MSIRACVVSLQFNDDQFSVYVHSEEVQPLVSPVETTEFLTNNEQAVIEEARVNGNPLLDVTPLLKSQAGEIYLGYLLRLAVFRVDSE